MWPSDPCIAFSYGLQNQEWAQGLKRVKYILPIQNLKLEFNNMSQSLLVTYERHVTFGGLRCLPFATRPEKERKPVVEQRE